MKKKSLILYFTILMLICQPALSCIALSDSIKTPVLTHCDSIKGILSNLQKSDAKARVYFGGYYETILTKYITPLNIRLVENNLSSANLIENQNKFADAKTIFANDFVKYQQTLEELIAMDCKNQPEEFYEKLVTVREKRKTMEQDILRIRTLLSEHIKLVNKIKAKL